MKSWYRAAAIVLGVACGFPLPGCARGVGTLQAHSLGSQPVVLRSDYRVAYFASDDKVSGSFMLSDSPLEDVVDGKVASGQILHLELLWLPKPGATPMDPSATNATIRHVVISGGEVGLYGGAGFAELRGSLDSDTIDVTLRDASVQLLEATPGFVDLLSPAQLTGTFKAVRHERNTRLLNNAASQMVTNALRKTRYVLNGKTLVMPAKAGIEVRCNADAGMPDLTR